MSVDSALEQRRLETFYKAQGQESKLSDVPSTVDKYAKDGPDGIAKMWKKLAKAYNTTVPPYEAATSPAPAKEDSKTEKETPAGLVPAPAAINADPIESSTVASAPTVVDSALEQRRLESFYKAQGQESKLSDVPSTVEKYAKDGPDGIAKMWKKLAKAYNTTVPPYGGAASPVPAKGDSTTKSETLVAENPAPAPDVKPEESPSSAATAPTVVDSALEQRRLEIFYKAQGQESKLSDVPTTIEKYAKDGPDSIAKMWKKLAKAYNTTVPPYESAAPPVPAKGDSKTKKESPVTDSPVSAVAAGAAPTAVDSALEQRRLETFYKAQGQESKLSDVPSTVEKYAKDGPDGIAKMWKKLAKAYNTTVPPYEATAPPAPGPTSTTTASAVVDVNGQITQLEDFFRSRGADDRVPTAKATVEHYAESGEEGIERMWWVVRKEFQAEVPPPEVQALKKSKSSKEASRSREKSTGGSPTTTSAAAGEEDDAASSIHDVWRRKFETFFAYHDRPKLQRLDSFMLMDGKTPTVPGGADEGVGASAGGSSPTAAGAARKREFENGWYQSLYNKMVAKYGPLPASAAKSSGSGNASLAQQEMPEFFQIRETPAVTSVVPGGTPEQPQHATSFSTRFFGGGAAGGPAHRPYGLQVAPGEASDYANSDDPYSLQQLHRGIRFTPLPQGTVVGYQPNERHLTQGNVSHIPADWWRQAPSNHALDRTPSGAAGALLHRGDGAGDSHLASPQPSRIERVVSGAGEAAQRSPSASAAARTYTPSAQREGLVSNVISAESPAAAPMASVSTQVSRQPSAAVGGTFRAPSAAGPAVQYVPVPSSGRAPSGSSAAAAGPQGSFHLSGQRAEPAAPVSPSPTEPGFSPFRGITGVAKQLPGGGDAVGPNSAFGLHAAPRPEDSFAAAQPAISSTEEVVQRVAAGSPLRRAGSNSHNQSTDEVITTAAGSPTGTRGATLEAASHADERLLVTVPCILKLRGIPSFEDMRTRLRESERFGLLQRIISDIALSVLVEPSQIEILRVAPGPLLELKFMLTEHQSRRNVVEGFVQKSVAGLVPLHHTNAYIHRKFGPSLVEPNRHLITALTRATTTRGFNAASDEAEPTVLVIETAACFGEFREMEIDPHNQRSRASSVLTLSAVAKLDAPETRRAAQLDGPQGLRGAPGRFVMELAESAVHTHDASRNNAQGVVVDTRGDVFSVEYPADAPPTPPPTTTGSPVPPEMIAQASSLHRAVSSGRERDGSSTPAVYGVVSGPAASGRVSRAPSEAYAHFYRQVSTRAAADTADEAPAHIAAETRDESTTVMSRGRSASGSGGGTALAQPTATSAGTPAHHPPEVGAHYLQPTTTPQPRTASGSRDGGGAALAGNDLNRHGTVAYFDRRPSDGPSSIAYHGEPSTAHVSGAVHGQRPPSGGPSASAMRAGSETRSQLPRQPSRDAAFPAHHPQHQHTEDPQSALFAAMHGGAASALARPYDAGGGAAAHPAPEVTKVFSPSSWARAMGADGSAGRRPSDVSPERVDASLGYGYAPSSPQSRAASGGGHHPSQPHPHAPLSNHHLQHMSAAELGQQLAQHRTTTNMIQQQQQQQAHQALQSQYPQAHQYQQQQRGDSPYNHNSYRDARPQSPAAGGDTFDYEPTLRPPTTTSASGAPMRPPSGGGAQQRPPSPLSAGGYHYAPSGPINNNNINTNNNSRGSPASALRPPSTAMMNGASGGGATGYYPQQQYHNDPLRSPPHHGGQPHHQYPQHHQQQHSMNTPLQHQHGHYQRSPSSQQQQQQQQLSSPYGQQRSPAPQQQQQQYMSATGYSHWASSLPRGGGGAPTQQQGYYPQQQQQQRPYRGGGGSSGGAGDGLMDIVSLLSR